MHKDSLYKMPEVKIETRWFTFENINGEKSKGGMADHGRKGAAATDIKAGETLILAHITGSGTVRRIWVTIGERGAIALRGLKIEMFWDGSETPAVQAPFGDFFCHQLGKMTP